MRQYAPRMIHRFAAGVKLPTRGDGIWLTAALNPHLGGASRDENPQLQPDFVKAALEDEG